jgi:hypothetical protein
MRRAVATAMLPIADMDDHPGPGRTTEIMHRRFTVNPDPSPPIAGPGRPSQRGTYITLFVLGAIFFLPAAALALYSVTILTQQDNEEAGFMFMMALCPGAIGFVLLVIGIASYGRRRA